MIRRWMIRGMAVGLLMLCVGAWGVSYWRCLGVWHGSLKADNVLTLRWGRLYYAYLARSWPAAPGSAVFNVAGADWQAADAKADFKLLGFTSLHGGNDWAATLPLWFPTLLSAALLWFVWRKTRPRYSGKGFPVDATARPDAPDANP